jgi:hypothetical protein
VFNAHTGQIDMEETRAFTYTMNRVIEYTNQMATERGGYNPELYSRLRDIIEEEGGNPQLSDE